MTEKTEVPWKNSSLSQITDKHYYTNVKVISNTSRTHKKVLVLDNDCIGRCQSSRHKISHALNLILKNKLMYEIAFIRTQQFIIQFECVRELDNDSDGSNGLVYGV